MTKSTKVLADVTVTVPALVTVKAGGKEHKIDLTNFPPESLANIFSYGMGRRPQDFVNSKAKAIRDSGETPDLDAIFAEWFTAYESGELSRARSSAPVDPVDSFRKRIGLDYIKGDSSAQKLAHTGYNAIPPKDQSARTAYLVKMVSGKASLDKMAKRQHEDAVAMGEIEVDLDLD